MRIRKLAALISVGAAAAMGASLLAAAPAHSHGSMSDPVSRVYNCFLEGPERPQSQACIDLVQQNGTQPLYDWHEVNQANAAGNHQAIIPDGQLCSAGRSKYSALDNTGTHWVATQMTSGHHNFEYRAPAPHVGYFELFITKEGWNPNSPLNWNDLEKFGHISNPTLSGGSYWFDATIPARDGRHLIYSIWQRTDSPEAFYTCSDVVFGDHDDDDDDNGGTDPTDCEAPNWASSVTYTGGDVVTYNNSEWEAAYWTRGDQPGSGGEWGPWRHLRTC
ncbi:lytic polysaccharide monooxygenase auxiliary activity family 9 protein [Natronoglycomyces albus]|uniref:Lytic polysaccharide monooxygenase n=1 Tax=Natronoglycomyces albus TaxID=2811108 RepID=A0A895XTC4_9ACTN|nr:lytic polysaccharide monooxygenase [Natronoglycomyces albus]QSB05786.1 lytic polysaccharide monooxygenase [Natronoglycomyces albus]